MHSLYFLVTWNFNEKLDRNYIWQNLHKHEGERNMHSSDILEENEQNKKNMRKIQIEKIKRPNQLVKGVWKVAEGCDIRMSDEVQ